MLWWPIEKSKNKYYTYGICGIIFAWLLIPAGSVVAQQSSVSVEVCGGGVQPPIIQVTEPVSDSIVNQPVVVVRGDVTNTTQVELYVDGNYSESTAVGANESTFETQATLSAGTHTIEAVAIGICDAPNVSDSVVVTYQPDVEPSGGGSTPTEVDDGDSVVVQDASLRGHEKASDSVAIPVIGPMIDIVVDFGELVGINSTVASTTPIGGIMRITVTIIALTTVVMASYLAPLAAQVIPGISRLFSVTSRRSMLYLGWVIRGAGLFAVAIAYFI